MNDQSTRGIEAPSTTEPAGAIVSDEQTVPRALPVSEEEIEETRSWIENANPSLSQIEARAAAVPSQ